MITDQEIALWLAWEDLRKEFPNVGNAINKGTQSPWLYDDWLRIHYPGEKSWRDKKLGNVSPEAVKAVHNSIEAAIRAATPVPPAPEEEKPKPSGKVDIPTVVDTTDITFGPFHPPAAKTLVFVPTYAQAPGSALEAVLEGVRGIEGSFDVLVLENSTSDEPWEWLKNSGWAKLPNWTFAHIRFPWTSDAQFFENAVKQAHVYEWARTYFLARGYDEMLIVEHDTIPPPNVLRQLHSHGVPVVLGTYRMPPDNHIVAGFFEHSIPYRPTAQYSITILHESTIAARKLIQVDVGGVGCALIQRSVLEQIGWRAYPLVQHHCDVYFAADLRRLGIPLFLDSGVRPVHIKSGLVTYADYFRKDGERGERMYEAFGGPPDHTARYDWVQSKIPKGGAILDIGSGSGYGTNRLANVGPAIGVEIDWTPCYYARRTYPNVHFINDDWFTAKLPEHSFDAVVSFENVEHVTEGFAYVAKAWEVIKPGGVFVISTPRRGTSGSPYHLREYEYAEFRAMLETHFTVESEAWQDANEVHEGSNPNAQTFIFTCRPKAAPTRPVASIFMGVCLKHPRDAAYLQSAVRSALKQSYPWIEVVLVHNGPIPDLPKDPRLKIFPQSRTAGPGEKDMNIGAAEALAKTTGEYVLRLDHDNAYRSSTVEDRVLFMLTHPDVGMAWSDGIVIDEDGHNVGPFKTLGEFDLKRLLEGNYIDGNSVIIQGPLWRELSFDLSAWVEDWDCWLRLADKHRIVKMPGETFFYRSHLTQMTRARSGDIDESVKVTRERARRLFEGRIPA